MQPANSGIAYLLWALCFFGICGGQRFYTGKVTSGLIYLFTFGVFGIGGMGPGAQVAALEAAQVGVAAIDHAGN